MSFSCYSLPSFILGKAFLYVEGKHSRLLERDKLEGVEVDDMAAELSVMFRMVSKPWL